MSLIKFADPYLRCDVCSIEVVGYDNASGGNTPCGHLGVTSVCASWGPVDGCRCRFFSWGQDHPLSPRDANAHAILSGAVRSAYAEASRT